jgi:DNA polymerase-3 subunit alpha
MTETQHTEKKETVPFVHLHNHSHYSLLDGLSSPENLAKVASEKGFPALALTDHGTCAGLYAFQKACKKYKIKPILGCEVYFTEDRHYKHKESRTYHLTLLAKNKQGLQNLFKLSTLGELEGKYRKPRIDFELLERHHEGLICTSGCPCSQLSMALWENNEERAEELVGQYKELFGDDYYIEIMTHKYIDNDEQENREKVVAKKLYSLAKKHNIKAICTNDAHYAERNDWKDHDILLAMQTHNHIKNPERFSFQGKEFYLKDYEEMKARYKSAPELLENTLDITNKIEENLLEFSGDLLPDFNLPQGYERDEDYLKDLIKDGMKSKGLFNNKEYRERIKYEMQAIIKCGYTKYFLILWDMINFAKREGIAVGCGRGSAAGCLCLYVLDIVKLDPIKHGLLFERFINPERISPPDVDIDFDYFRRDEVFDYMSRKYGNDHCSKIGTYNTLKARAVIRYVTKALDLGKDWERYVSERKTNDRAVMGKESLYLSDRIAKSVPEGPGVTIESAIKDSNEFRYYMGKYPELKRAALKIENKISAAGVHAAGLIVSRDPIVNMIPLREKDGVVASQFDKDEVEELGLLKFDCLAIKTLTVVDQTVKDIKERHGIEIDIDALDPSDTKVFDLFNGKYKNIDTRGIFQFESYGISELLKNVHVDTFNDLVVCNALYRPGPLGSGMHDLYCDYKHGRKKIEPLHPKMGEILEETYSLMVFQESFMKISQELAGFTKGQSDLLRKAVGKKKLDLLADQEKNFVDGCLKNGIDKKIAEKIFEQINYFGGYGFNKSHSAAYGMLAYQTAYLKVYYPLEFMKNLLSSEVKREDKLKNYLKQAIQMDIVCLGSELNESKNEFVISRKKNKEGKEVEYLRMPFSMIKGVGDAAVEEIVKNQPYENLKDFLLKVNLSKVNVKVFQALASDGCFERTWGIRGDKIMSEYEDVKKTVEKEKKKRREREKHFEKVNRSGNLFDMDKNLVIS